MASERPLPETIMEHIYVCKKCGYTMTVEKGENRFCKNDGTKMTDTNVSKSEWDTYSDEIHQKVISQVKKTGKGVNSEDFKPKPKPQSKPETQQKTEPVPESVNTEEDRKKSADYNMEPVKKLKELKITAGSDGSSVVHTGNIVMTIMIIISIINGFNATMIEYDINDLFRSINGQEIDASGLNGIWIGITVAAIGILLSVAVGKIIQGIGLSARNTYETKMMLKEALENQDYIIVKNSDQKESSESENQDHPDAEKK